MAFERCLHWIQNLKLAVLVHFDFAFVFWRHALSSGFLSLYHLHHCSFIDYCIFLPLRVAQPGFHHRLPSCTDFIWFDILDFVVLDICIGLLSSPKLEPPRRFSKWRCLPVEDFIYFKRFLTSEFSNTIRDLYPKTPILIYWDKYCLLDRYSRFFLHLSNTGQINQNLEMLNNSHIAPIW